MKPVAVVVEPGCGCRLELRNGRWVRAVTCPTLAACRARRLAETGDAALVRRLTVTATRRPPR
jgi:hypothetical protein